MFISQMYLTNVRITDISERCGCLRSTPRPAR